MDTRRLNFTVVLALVVIGALLLPSVTFAHKMEISASTNPADPGRIRVYVGYEFGEASGEATVILKNAAGVEVSRTITADDGECFLPRPNDPGKYTITADDGAGHKETIVLTLEANEVPARAASETRNQPMMAVLGLTMIAGVSLAARWLTRKKPQTESDV